MSSSETELLIALTRDGSQTLQSQIERQIRAAVRSGALRPETPLPSTRALAAELGVSRPLVVDAYAQLAAEGYLALRQGAQPRVAAFTPTAESLPLAAPPPAEAPRYDFRPGFPDLTSFPRAAWMRASQAALAKMTGDDFGYTDRHGVPLLREALAEYLGRVRGVIAEPRQLVVTSGFEQGRTLVGKTLRAMGRTKLAVENPSYSEWRALLDIGFDLIPIDVDEQGIRTDQLASSDAEAVLVTPAHQFPTGVVMSGERRLALAAWLRARDAFAIEDDYDAEFRYDRAPVGALQGFAPAQVIYAGTASKTLAPALRLGWLAVPERLLEGVQQEQRLADYGCSRLDQHALAEFLTRGDLDRHLRQMRIVYRDRREALLAALATELPDAEIGGIAAGLHATVRLNGAWAEAAIRAAALRRGVALEFMSRHTLRPFDTRTTLLLSYARNPESVIRTGIRALAAALADA